MVDLLIGVFIVMCSAFASFVLSLVGSIMARAMFGFGSRVQGLLDNVVLVSLVLLVLSLVAFGLILWV